MGQNFFFLSAGKQWKLGTESYRKVSDFSQSYFTFLLCSLNAVKVAASLTKFSDEQITQTGGEFMGRQDALKQNKIKINKYI